MLVMAFLLVAFLFLVQASMSAARVAVKGFTVFGGEGMVLFLGLVLLALVVASVSVVIWCLLVDSTPWDWISR